QAGICLGLNHHSYGPGFTPLRAIGAPDWESHFLHENTVVMIIHRVCNFQNIRSTEGRPFDFILFPESYISLCIGIYTCPISIICAVIIPRLGVQAIGKNWDAKTARKLIVVKSSNWPRHCSLLDKCIICCKSVNHLDDLCGKLGSQ